MTIHTQRLRAVLVAGALALAALTACATGAPVPADDPAAVDPGTAPVADGPRPAWYGESVDDRGCPLAPAGAPLAASDEAQNLLGIALPDGWCMFTSVDYTQFYIIPSTIDPDFAADARALLEPAGWAFDPAKDDSPHWSWITEYPQAALELGFTDGDVDGSIFFTTSMTEDEGSSRHLWHSGLIKTFSEFQPGDYVAILGFW